MKNKVALSILCSKSVFITVVIKAFMGMDGGMVDFPSVYLHTENENKVNMQLRLPLVELTASLSPTVY